eukprot:SAG11_NODE_879_length_6759_cov_5.103904_6_plen_174_part_00
MNQLTALSVFFIFLKLLKFADSDKATITDGSRSSGPASAGPWPMRSKGVQTAPWRPDAENFGRASPTVDPEHRAQLLAAAGRAGNVSALLTSERRRLQTAPATGAKRADPVQKGVPDLVDRLSKPLPKKPASTSTGAQRGPLLLTYEKCVPTAAVAWRTNRSCQQRAREPHLP